MYVAVLPELHVREVCCLIISTQIRGNLSTAHYQTRQTCTASESSMA
jgi:hypothetical protein